MKLCTKHGNGVCLNCDQTPPSGYGDICRYIAEDWVNVLEELLHTELSDEQKNILRDFGIMFYKTE